MRTLSPSNHILMIYDMWVLETYQLLTHISQIYTDATLKSPKIIKFLRVHSIEIKKNSKMIATETSEDTEGK